MIRIVSRNWTNANDNVTFCICKIFMRKAQSSLSEEQDRLRMAAPEECADVVWNSGTSRVGIAGIVLFRIIINKY
jgi:hypothetical protein